MINSTHPLYDEYYLDWIMLRDSYKGEKSIKLKGVTYLPPTDAQIIDGMVTTDSAGYQSYSAYKTRAVYPDYIHLAIESYIGKLHNKQTIIKLPPEMEFMREKATVTGDSLDNLLRRIHVQALITGRVGLLLDLDGNPKYDKPMPYIAMYHAENIINWDDGFEIDGLNALNLVVLDESSFVRRSSFQWQWQNRYRILSLGDLIDNEDENSGSYYQQGVSTLATGESNLNAAMLDAITPTIYGQKLEEIPFVFINSKDTLPTPDVPPLLGLAQLALAIYRAEADYRRTLYMQGQDTLVIIGGNNNPDEDTRVGAGAKIDVHQGGDAKFIGVSSSGLSEMRQSLENDHSKAIARADQMSNSKSTQESGDALRLRITSSTANLTQVAITTAYGLEKILKLCAKWMRLDPDLVTVIPNLDFVDTTLHGQDFVQLMQAKSMGLPLSDESLHELLRNQNLTSIDFAKELDLAREQLAEKQEAGIVTTAKNADGKTVGSTSNNGVSDMSMKSGMKGGISGGIKKSAVGDTPILNQDMMN